MVVSKKNKSTIEERSGTGLASQVLCTCVQVPQQFFTTAVRSTRVVPSL